MILVDMYWGLSDLGDVDEFDCTTNGIWCGYCTKYWNGWVKFRIDARTNLPISKAQWEEDISTSEGGLQKLKLALLAIIKLMIERGGKRNVKIQWLEVDKAILKEYCNKEVAARTTEVHYTWDRYKLEGFPIPISQENIQKGHREGEYKGAAGVYVPDVGKTVIDTINRHVISKETLRDDGTDAFDGECMDRKQEDVLCVCHSVC